MVPIILILGSSSSGKSTICSNSAFVNFYKQGIDLFMECKKFDVLLDVINIIVTQLFEFGCGSMLKSVITNRGMDMNIAIKEITKSIVNEEPCFLSDIFNMDIEKHKLLVFKIIYLLIFEEAAHQALKNKPVILDMVPLQEYDTIKLFKDTLAKYNLEGTIVLVHTSIVELTKRILQRNENTMDQRVGMFPFEQYADIFNKNEKKLTVTNITPNEIINAIAPLQSKYNIYASEIIPYSDTKVKNFLIKLGFTNDQIRTNQAIEISSNVSKYDLIIDNTQNQDRNIKISILYNFAFRDVLNHIVNCFKSEYSLWKEYHKKEQLDKISNDLRLIFDYDEVNTVVQCNTQKIDCIGGDILQQLEMDL